METIYNKKHQLILGMSLGDGYITKRNTLTVTHCLKQLFYLSYKRTLLINAGIGCSNIYQINNNGFTAYRFETQYCEEIKDIRNILYLPKKTISGKILDLLTEQEVAIWYLDDGGLSKHYKNGLLAGNELMLNTGLQKEENLIIIDWFRTRYNINFSLCKNHNCYRLRCGTKEARKLMDFIYPYCIDVSCLYYKIDVKDYKYCGLGQVTRSAGDSLLNQDIVSTSTEMLSSHNNDGRELTTHVEENVV